MTRTSKISISVAASVLAMCLSFGASFLSAGVGHGSYLPFAVLFPFAFLASIPAQRIGAVAGILAVAQFPAYGFVMGRAWLRDTLPRVATYLLITHAIAATVCTVIFLAT